MKIKPCPFCGSKSVEYYWEEDYERCYASCDTCDSQGPYGNDEENAVELWNNRNNGLSELVRAHLSLLDQYRNILDLDSYTQSHYSITLLQKHIGESETALRKAVGREG
jgi:Lar family restriction alleviation protein